MDRAGNEKLDNRNLRMPVKAGAVLAEGTIATVGADGYLEQAAAKQGVTAVGCIIRYCSNENGADGEAHALVRRGAFVWNNDGSIKETDIFKTCYIKDAQTVTMEPEGTSAAGVVLEVQPDGVTVEMLLSREALPAVSETGSDTQ